MPYLATAQEWLTQSALLLQARPTTTRITTKYTLENPTKTLSAIKKSQKSKSRKPKPDASATTSTDSPIAQATKGTLTLKTYDHASGTTLKYQTDKAAEVGRLVLAQSRLGRTMAGLPELKEDAVMLDVSAEAEGGAPSGIATPVTETKVTTGGGPGGKKGKKKGKK